LLKASDDDNLFSGEPWADCEIEYLKNIYGHALNVEVALDLKRSTSAVGAKAYVLGITSRTNAKRSTRSDAVARRALTLALRRYFRGAHDAV